MDVDSIGKSRAEIATQFLLELNPDVQGDYVDENPLQLFEDNPHFFSGFNAVITTSVSERYRKSNLTFILKRNIHSLQRKLFQILIK